MRISFKVNPKDRKKIRENRWRVPPRHSEVNTNASVSATAIVNVKANEQLCTRVSMYTDRSIDLQKLTSLENLLFELSKFLENTRYFFEILSGYLVIFSTFSKNFSYNFVILQAPSWMMVKPAQTNLATALTD